MKGKKVKYLDYYADVIEIVGDWIVIAYRDKGERVTKQVKKEEVIVIGHGN